MGWREEGGRGRERIEGREEGKWIVRRSDAAHKVNKQLNGSTIHWEGMFPSVREREVRIIREAGGGGGCGSNGVGGRSK